MVNSQEKWNQKYRLRAKIPLDGPDPFLSSDEILQLLSTVNGDDNDGTASGGRRRTVLDVACGDGRNSLYLAERGWNVTSVDISDVGLQHLEDYAKERGVLKQVTTRQVDLETEDDVEDPIDLLLNDRKVQSKDEGGGTTTFQPAFDVVMIINYLPSQRLWTSLPSLVQTNGLLIFCTMNQRNPPESFSPKFAIPPGVYRETGSMPPQFKLIHFSEPSFSGKLRDGYVFRKVLK